MFYNSLVYYLGIAIAHLVDVGLGGYRIKFAIRVALGAIGALGWWVYSSKGLGG